ncbi:MAG: sporulation integral membrane protein YtvI [Clostridia bacterium]|nr:sporulation integral membrane protein YtvI [Clostridia bacterium]
MKPSIKYCKILLNIVTMILAVLFCIYILPRIIVYFMPFVVGGCIALLANPMVKFLEKRMKILRKAGSAVVIVFTIAIVVLILYLIISMLISQTVGFAENIPDLWASVTANVTEMTTVFEGYLHRMPDSVQEWFNSLSENLNANTSSFIKSMGVPVAEAASSFAMNLPSVIIGIIMAVLSAYFFVAEKEYVVEKMQKMIPASAITRWNVVYGTLKDAVGGYFKAQFKIMGVVYLILLAGLLILRVDYALLIALLIALLDFLPFFGTGAVMWPWAIYQLITGNYRMAIGLAVIWAISQLIRQLIQPKMVSDSIGLAPIPTLLLLFIGFKLNGAFGLIVAVPIGMIVYNLYRAGMFSNFIRSVKILFKDASKFRRIPEDME